MAKRTRDDEAPVTISRTREEVSMIEDLLRPGRGVKDTLEEMIGHTLPRFHFLEVAAPRDSYAVKKAVSKEEIAAFRRSNGAKIVQEALRGGCRKEAVAFGLLAAAHELCIGMARKAGYVYPEQNGDDLALETLTGLFGMGPFQDVCQTGLTHPGDGVPRLQ